MCRGGHDDREEFGSESEIGDESERGDAELRGERLLLRDRPRMTYDADCWKGGRSTESHHC